MRMMQPKEEGRREEEEHLKRRSSRNMTTMTASTHISIQLMMRAICPTGERTEPSTPPFPSKKRELGRC